MLTMDNEPTAMRGLFLQAWQSRFYGDDCLLLSLVAADLGLRCFGGTSFCARMPVATAFYEVKVPIQSCL
jgi:hypothetical protein